MTLVEENQRIHKIIEEKYLVFLEDLTRCDIDAAQNALADFRDALFLHMKTEEALVCPAFQKLGIHGGKRILEQVDGDHTILLRTLAKVDRWLAEKMSGRSGEGETAPLAQEEREPAADRLRRSMVLALDSCVRVRSVFEHHTLREERDFYSHLDEVAEVSTRERITQALRADFPPGPERS
jgi:hypothetical protein